MKQLKKQELTEGKLKIHKRKEMHNFKDSNKKKNQRQNLTVMQNWWIVLHPNVKQSMNCLKIKTEITILRQS